MSCLLDDEIVVAATQSAVASHHGNEAGLHWPNLDERRIHILDAQPLVDAEEHLSKRRKMHGDGEFSKWHLVEQSSEAVVRHRQQQCWDHGAAKGSAVTVALRELAGNAPRRKGILCAAAGGASTLTRFSAKGRPLTTASCARRTFAAATSFMASVIFIVFFTESIRPLSSFWPATICGGRGSDHWVWCLRSTLQVLPSVGCRYEASDCWSARGAEPADRASTGNVRGDHHLQPPGATSVGGSDAGPHLQLAALRLPHAPPVACQLRSAAPERARGRRSGERSRGCHLAVRGELRHHAWAVESADLLIQKRAEGSRV